MAWWGWIVIGTLLFCAELFAIDAQFYLIFIGAGAIIVGLTGLLGVEFVGEDLRLLLRAIGAVEVALVRGVEDSRVRRNDVGAEDPYRNGLLLEKRLFGLDGEDEVPILAETKRYEPCELGGLPDDKLLLVAQAAARDCPLPASAAVVS